MPLTALGLSVSGQVNYFFSQNNINMELSFLNTSFESYAKIDGNFLKIEKDGKTLALDLDAMKTNKNSILSLEGGFRPAKIIIDAVDDPKMIFAGNGELYSIRQIGNGTTKIFFMSPALSQENSPSVFIAEHYYPDRLLSDRTRTDGVPKLVMIAKNNPKVMINDLGMFIVPETLSISKRSFFESDLSSSQVDILYNKSITEVIGQEDSLILKISPLSFDYVFDRGYSTGPINKINSIITGFDVTPDDCRKLGFAFLPGYGYDFIGKTNEFTNNFGWALGIAYSKLDDFKTSLDDMAIFVNKAYENNLTPIIRVESTGYDALKTAGFINRLQNLTGGKLTYIQLGDMTNLQGISPTIYADYVISVKRMISPDLKIISAALMPGRYGQVGNYTRQDSEKYMAALADIQGYSSSIDYIGAYAYGMNASGTDCMKASTLYPGEKICIDDYTSYKMEQEIMKEKTGNDFKVIITGAGYPMQDENIRRMTSLLQSFKEDKNVVAAIIYYANSWESSPDDAWLNEDQALSEPAKIISGKICR